MIRSIPGHVLSTCSISTLLSPMCNLCRAGCRGFGPCLGAGNPYLISPLSPSGVQGQQPLPGCGVFPPHFSPLAAVGGKKLYMAVFKILGEVSAVFTSYSVTGVIT